VSLKTRLALYVAVAFTALVSAYLLLALFYVTHRTQKELPKSFEELERSVRETRRLVEEPLPIDPLEREKRVFEHVKRERSMKMLVVIYEKGKIKVEGDADPSLLPVVAGVERYGLTGSLIRPVFVFHFPLKVEGRQVGDVYLIKEVRYELALLVGYLFLVALVPVVNLVVSVRFLKEVIKEVAQLKKLAAEFGEGKFDRIEELRKSIETSKRKDELFELKLAILKMVENLSQLIAKTEREKSLYESLALTDPLTGLYNRRMFLELARKELSKAQRYGEPFSVVIFDIDHFKKINDTYGHDVGDLALKHVAQLLKSNVRAADVVARWGGEEFVLLLPKTGPEEAYRVAEKLRKLVERSWLELPGGGRLKMTVSGGVSSYREGVTLDELFKEADEALYRAKRMGRNRVELYGAFSPLKGPEGS